jgi:hypothetical protein
MPITDYQGGFKRLQGGGIAYPIVAAAVSRTLTEADSGYVFEAGAVDLVFTLPPTQRGLVFTFVVKTPSATTGLTVAPAAVDKVMGNGFTSLDNKGAVNTAATDREGDLIEVTGDGVDGWYITRVIGTWARVA